MIARILSNVATEGCRRERNAAARNRQRDARSAAAWGFDTHYRLRAVEMRESAAYAAQADTFAKLEVSRESYSVVGHLHDKRVDAGVRFDGNPQRSLRFGHAVPDAVLHQRLQHEVRRVFVVQLRRHRYFVPQTTGESHLHDVQICPRDLDLVR